MIAVFGCKCHNAIPIARKVLADAKIPEWLEVPIHKGHDKAKELIPQIDTKDEQKKEELLDCILHRSSYVIIVGWDINQLDFADVASGSPIDTSLGKVIAKDYYFN